MNVYAVINAIFFICRNIQFNNYIYSVLSQKVVSLEYNWDTEH